jgi:4-amino-4-deoxy-L-arabinose transferase-like glycosyltransferase
MAGQGTENTSGIPPVKRVPAHSNIDWIRVAEIAFLCGLFAAGLLVRLWPIWKVHFWDEAVYLQNAEVICCGKNNYSELSSRPLLLSLLYAGLFRVWHNVYAASLLVAALNALGPLLLYRAGRTLHGRPAGIIASLLLAFSPSFAQWGNTLLTDCPALTLTLLAFCLLLKAVAADSMVWLALAGFVTGLSGLMRFTALVTLFVCPFYFLRKGRLLQRATWFGLGVGLSLGPYLLWTRLAYGSFLGTLRLAIANVAGSVEPRLYYLQNFGEVFPWITVAGGVLWFVAWLQDSLVTWKREGEEIVIRIGQRAPRLRLASDAILWGWALLVLVYFSHLPHKELRYIAPLAVPWLLLAGRGLAILTRGRTWQTRALGMGVLVLVLGYSFAPIRERFRVPLISPYISEEKEVADYLNQQAKRKGLLYCNFNCPVFGYYTWLAVHVLQKEDMRFYSAFPDDMPEDGYLVIYKQVPKEPTVAWVEGDPHFRRMKEFPSMVVYEYHQARFP